MLDDRAYMERALELARQAAARGEVPVGAVLVDAEGAVLADAGNSPIGLKDPTAHAEMLVLRRAGLAMGNYRLTGTTLYVTIEPCPMCAGALVLARIGRLVFGASDPKTGACGSLYNIVQDTRLNHQVEVTAGVLEEACRALIRDFFRGRRQNGKTSGEVPKWP